MGDEPSIPYDAGGIAPSQLFINLLPIHRSPGAGGGLKTWWEAF
jgi:hypothetical protein